MNHLFYKGNVYNIQIDNRAFLFMKDTDHDRLLNINSRGIHILRGS